MTLRVISALALLCIALGDLATAQTSDRLPVGAPFMTGIVGKTGKTAFGSVWRVICLPTNSSGSGFLHKSGKMVTAAHVVRGCKTVDLALLDASGQRHAVA